MGFIKRIKSKKGQGLVEMAVVLPVLILCMGVIITAGQLLFAKMTVQMAAFEGARSAVVKETRSSAQSAAKQKAESVLDNGIGLENYNYIFSAEGWTKGDQVTYTVSVRVKTLFPVIGVDGFSTNQTIKSTIVMMVERN